MNYELGSGGSGGSGEAVLSPQNPITLSPYHPITRSPDFRILITDH
jgi:hypothetical protein